MAKAITYLSDDRAEVRHRAPGDLWLTCTTRSTSHLLGCASLLVAQGSPTLYVKERLGHSSITTTINLYGHMFPSIEASLADALDGMYDDDAPDAAEG